MAKTNTQWFRTLAIGIELSLATTVFVGCTIPGIIEPPKPCTCDCDCQFGSGFCADDDGDIVAGTPSCGAACHEGGTSRNQCVDASVGNLPPTDPPPPPPECTDETPGLWTFYQFCETCSDFPPLEKDFNAGGCTMSDAEDRAQEIADLDGDDCTVEVGSCTAL